MHPKKDASAARPPVLDTHDSEIQYVRVILPYVQYVDDIEEDARYIDLNYVRFFSVFVVCIFVCLCVCVYICMSHKGHLKKKPASGTRVLMAESANMTGCFVGRTFKV